MASDDTAPESAFSRRKILSGLGATSAASLSGCSFLGGGDGGNGGDGGGNSSSGDGNNNQELGERVPGISVNYYSGVSSMESTAPALVDSLERLGVSAGAQPVQIASLVNSLYNDQRNSLLPLIAVTADVDPQKTINRFSIAGAGSGVGQTGLNMSNFTNCRYSFLADEQTKYTDSDRKTIVNEAQSVLSEEVAVIPTLTGPSIRAWRSDQIEVGGLGPNNQPSWNVNMFTETTTKDGTDVIHASGLPYAFNTINFLTIQAPKQGPWLNILHSPLTQLNSEFEFENDLAASISVEQDATRVVVDLKPDATFHNGDKVTAADVKYTYELLSAGSEAGVYPAVSQIPIDDIEEVDAETVAFNLTRPFSPLVGKHFNTWGILHKSTWEAVNAKENPAEAAPDTPLVGSGPYTMESFSTGTSMYMEPYDDHHTYAPDAPVQITVMGNPQTRYQSLQAGELNLTGMTAGQHGQVQDNENIETNVQPGIMNEILTPNMAASPTKFLEFRKAIAAAINTETINEVTGGGLVEPERYVSIFTHAHPYRAPDDMLYEMQDSSSGSEEAARAYLSEAGWGWDGSGNLRYPADADLSPQWETGGTPDPANFDCLDENGYTQPEDQELPI